MARTAVGSLESPGAVDGALAILRTAVTQWMAQQGSLSTNQLTYLGQRTAP